MHFEQSVNKIDFFCNKKWPIISGDIEVVGVEAELMIESAHYEHAGDYLCEASNIIGDALGDVIKIIVDGKPEIRSFPPTNRTIQFGEDFEFVVNFCSGPRPEVIWLRDEMEISRGKLLEKEERLNGCYTTKLNIPNIDRTHSGQYKVIISSSHGNESLRFRHEH